MKGVADSLPPDVDGRNVAPEQRFEIRSEIMPAAGDFHRDGVALETVAADMGKSGIAAQ